MVSSPCAFTVSRINVPSPEATSDRGKLERPVAQALHVLVLIAIDRSQAERRDLADGGQFAQASQLAPVLKLRAVNRVGEIRVSIEVDHVDTDGELIYIRYGDGDESVVSAEPVASTLALPPRGRIVSVCIQQIVQRAVGPL